MEEQLRPKKITKVYHINVIVQKRDCQEVVKQVQMAIANAGPKGTVNISFIDDVAPSAIEAVKQVETKKPAPWKKPKE